MRVKVRVLCVCVCVFHDERFEKSLHHTLRCLSTKLGLLPQNVTLIVGSCQSVPICNVNKLLIGGAYMSFKIAVRSNFAREPVQLLDEASHIQ